MKGIHTYKKLNIFLRRGPKSMWLNATRRGQEPYALEIQRNDQFQPGAGAGLSLGKEAAFDLGLAGWIGF